DFDQTISLNESPVGLAWNGLQYLIANRQDPFGFLIVDPSGQLTKFPTREPEYGQQVGFHSVAWNGAKWIGIADGAVFQSPSPLIFTLHHPTTLAMERFVPAPSLVGAVVWDGAFYWAGTRRNTEDSNEPAYLYQLD